MKEFWQSQGAKARELWRPRVCRGIAAAAVMAGLWVPSHGASAEPLISPDRCAKNRAAKPITFLTSFAYAASSGILDVIAAQELGYFEALCLAVTIQPGSANAQLVSAGTAQIAGLGDAASALVAIDNGASIVGIATYGNTSAIELITMKKSGIDTLKALVGKTVGYKVAVAPQVAAMLVAAGVSVEAINFVSVGYDPIVLANGQVAALIGYKSNEARTLEKRGAAITEWNPEDYGIHSTFNVLVANRQWAADHPTAVEDFLRATLHAYTWITESDAHLDQALGYAARLSTAGFDRAVAKDRWTIEARLIADHQPPTRGLGRLDDAAWQPEADLLVRARLVGRAPVVATARDNSYIDAIYHGGVLIWPAP